MSTNAVKTTAVEYRGYLIRSSSLYPRYWVEKDHRFYNWTQDEAAAKRLIDDISKARTHFWAGEPRGVLCSTSETATGLKASSRPDDVTCRRCRVLLGIDREPARYEQVRMGVNQAPTIADMEVLR